MSPGRHHAQSLPPPPVDPMQTETSRDFPLNMQVISHWGVHSTRLCLCTDLPSADDLKLGLTKSPKTTNQVERPEVPHRVIGYSASVLFIPTFPNVVAS